MPLTILGISGSLRTGSFNTKLLQAAVERCPAGAVINILSWADVPVFNGDQEADPPASVTRVRADIAAADAILFVTPEYNYSIPGPLKNLIDWASRPRGSSVWDGKPCVMMGCGGRMGTVRAQVALRQTLVGLNMHAVMAPEVFVSIPQSFDAQGAFTDGNAGELITRLLQELIRLTQRFTA